MIGISTFSCAEFSKSNGVVTDSKTGLEWQDDYLDNGGEIKYTHWAEAIDYCETLNLDGGNWRLPNRKELLSIIDYARYNPSISTIFTNTASLEYWTSTTHIRYTTSAWIVSFNSGISVNYNGKLGSDSVRCVRAGQ